MLLADYSRRGFLDGIGIRLRPSACAPQAQQGGVGLLPPTSSASRWRARRRCCRSREDVRHWHAAARGGRLPAARRIHGPRAGRAPPQPDDAPASPPCTVGEQIAALERIAGKGVTARIRREPDPTIQRIVAGWPRDFAPTRAPELGFRAEASFDEIIRVHIEGRAGRVVRCVTSAAGLTAPIFLKSISDPPGGSLRHSPSPRRSSTISWPRRAISISRRRRSARRRGSKTSRPLSRQRTGWRARKRPSAAPGSVVRVIRQTSPPW